MGICMSGSKTIDQEVDQGPQFILFDVAVPSGPYQNAMCRSSFHNWHCDNNKTMQS